MPPLVAWNALAHSTKKNTPATPAHDHDHDPACCGGHAGCGHDHAEAHAHGAQCDHDHHHHAPGEDCCGHDHSHGPKHIYVYSPSGAVRDKAAFRRAIKRLQDQGHEVEVDTDALQQPPALCR